MSPRMIISFVFAPCHSTLPDGVISTAGYGSIAWVVCLGVYGRVLSRSRENPSPSPKVLPTEKPLQTENKTCDTS